MTIDIERLWKQLAMCHSYASDFENTVVANLIDEIEDLRKSNYEQLDEINEMSHNCNEFKGEIEALRKQCADQTECIADLRQWSKSYPVTVFREPDFKRAGEVLNAAGMTLDALSASTCRVVLGDVVRRLDSVYCELNSEIGK